MCNPILVTLLKIAENATPLKSRQSLKCDPIQRHTVLAYLQELLTLTPPPPL